MIYLQQWAVCYHLIRGSIQAGETSRASTTTAASYAEPSTYRDVKLWWKMRCMKSRCLKCMPPASSKWSISPSIVRPQARLGARTPARSAIKRPLLGSAANRCCICLTRRQHRERLKSCQIECDLQSATLMVKGREVNCLAFSFYSGWIQAGRRGPAAGLAGSHPQWHPTVYTTRAECHRRGAPFTRGLHAKETPIRS